MHMVKVFLGFFSEKLEILYCQYLVIIRIIVSNQANHDSFLYTQKLHRYHLHTVYFSVIKKIATISTTPRTNFVTTGTTVPEKDTKLVPITIPK